MIFLIYIAIYIYVYARHLNNRDLVFQEMHYIKPDISAIVLQLNKLSQMLSDNSLERDVVIKAANFIKVYGSDSSIQEELRMVLKNFLVEALTNLELNEVVIARDDGLNDATALLHKPTFTYGTVPM